LETNKPANTEPELTPTTENRVEVQPPVELDDLQKKIHAYPEKQWNLLQRIGGGVLGLLCGYLLTYFSAYESIGMYGTIAAVLIALFVPGMIEKRVKRSVQKGRIALMLGLGAWLLIYLGVMLLKGVPMIGPA
jgi:hypothetical protein